MNTIQCLSCQCVKVQLFFFKSFSCSGFYKALKGFTLKILAMLEQFGILFYFSKYISKCYWPNNPKHHKNHKGENLVLMSSTFKNHFWRRKTPQMYLQYKDVKENLTRLNRSKKINFKNICIFRHGISLNLLFPLLRDNFLWLEKKTPNK